MLTQQVLNTVTQFAATAESHETTTNWYTIIMFIVAILLGIFSYIYTKNNKKPGHFTNTYKNTVNSILPQRLRGESAPMFLLLVIFAILVVGQTILALIF